MSEKEWFPALTAKRKNTVSVLKEEGLLRIFISHIVDTYRESAHFIYELLQNADDVKARVVRLDLKADGIWFAHNGTTSFSLSDPDVERLENASPGHINAITTFSLSTKKEDIENKIGKFGIGFKSVFQYTDNPHIYNDPYCFRIEGYMIPYEIECRPDVLRKTETTAFWLPFDKTDKTADESYSEISAKLKRLKNPLLFLRNIEEINIQIENEVITFTKDVKKINDSTVPDVEIMKVTLDDDIVIRYDQKVIITDSATKEHLFPISVGFTINKTGNVTASDEYKHYFQYAWCFFPTTQETKLNYIVNAPFILTPNREALRETRTENKQIITALGKLFEVAIENLKKLKYINEVFFTTIPNPQNLPAEFKALGEKIIGKLKGGEFIPADNGEYITVQNAYLCNEPLLAALLSYNNHQPLRILTGRPHARIVFRDGKLFDDRNLFVYFYKTLTSEGAELQSTWLGSKYDVKFLKDTSEHFRTLFFQYLSERHTTILGVNQPLWKKAFVLVYNGDETQYLVQPKNSKGESQIFMGGPKIKERYVAADYLIADPEINKFLQNVLGCRQPDEFDDFLLGLSAYEDAAITIDQSNAIATIETIKRFFVELSSNKKDKLLAKIKTISFFPVIDDNGNLELFNPFLDLIYFPGKELVTYFTKCSVSVNWVDLSMFPDYTSMETDYRVFFREISVEFEPYYNSETKTLDGLTEFLPDISFQESIYLSLVLINKRTFINFKNDLKILKENEWLFDTAGNKLRPNQINSGNLNKKYSSDLNAIHLDLGAIVDTHSKRYDGLSDVERSILEALGTSIDTLSTDEIKSALAELIRKKKGRNTPRDGSESSGTERNNDKTVDDPTTPQGLIQRWTRSGLEKNQKDFDNDQFSDNIIPKLPNSKDFWKDDESQRDKIENPGGFVSPPIIGMKYQRDQENRQQHQIDKEIELNYKRNQLIELAGNFEHYSFGWFKALLELEDNFTAEDRVKRNPIHLTFNEIEIDEDGILILSGAAVIPPNIEDVGDISIQIYAGDEKITVKGEILSPKKRALYIKLSNEDQLMTFKSKGITRAVVEVSTPDFILERLKTAFAKLPFEDADNLKNPLLLPSDLNFIFGPPGTGKTTYLSWLIGGQNPDPIDFCGKPIKPFMEGNLKILVLTPTNKAADVLTEKILDNYEKADLYPQWLIRFGQSQTLEREPIFVGDRNLETWVKDKCTLITTIARYPYDFFKILDNGKIVADTSLREFSWDVIVFDEASMISQAALLFVIFYAKKINPKIQFFIGGDPFQIPPIIQFEYPYWSYLPDPAFDEGGNPIIDEHGEQLAWKQDGGNIYSFIELMKDDSFTSPETNPHQFQIHLLLKQYRSLKPIGALFSNYRYGGKLTHARDEGGINLNPKLAVKEMVVHSLPLNTINFIHFPVKKYGGIYRVRTIKGSPYQIYSAVFTVELIRYIQKHISVKANENYKIGIIGPYAMQSTLISKLLDKIGGGKVEVVTGTVHGFQGDECDLVIVVLNPPRSITRSPRSFLNKKNILNVAISRARDKMIILTPYDPDKELNVDDLHQVRWIEKLAGKLLECKGFVTGYEATEIELNLWGNENYIDEVTFATSHQNVNIYTVALKKYEIRHDDNAIDVQVNTKQK